MTITEKASIEVLPIDSIDDGCITIVGVRVVLHLLFLAKDGYRGISLMKAYRKE